MDISTRTQQLSSLFSYDKKAPARSPVYGEASNSAVFFRMTKKQI